MIPSTRICALGAAWLLIVPAAAAIGWGLAFYLARRRSRNLPSSEGQAQRDWSIPSIDAQAREDSPFHRWEPATKIAALLVFMFCAASLTHFGTVAAALALSLTAVAAARIPWHRPVRRLSAMSAFLGMFLVVMPLTVPLQNGDTLLVFGGFHRLPVNLRGLELAGLICLKAAAIALLADPLLATAPFSTTIQALTRLRVPRIVCQMILMSHRYIYLFDHEATRMNRGMHTRGFRRRTDLNTLRATGNFLGMLFVRSFERTQRVYDAMLARGYDGNLPAEEIPPPSRRDWLKAALWTAAGLTLVLADRL